MLPALTTKPRQAVRQVKGLTNDSIDSYSNMPLGGSASTAYVDNTESGSGTAHVSPLASSRATINTGRASVAKTTSGEDRVMARVVRDRNASGEEELSLQTGDVVKVLSTKRTGYLKCEAGDEVGYIPSSYLEFLDVFTEVENGTSNGVSEEAQRAAEKQRKRQQKKEKRRKEKREANEGNELNEVVPSTARSPRKEITSGDNEGTDSPRKRKKKERKHRDREAGEETHRSAASEEPLTARSRTGEDTERSRTRSKHSKKKRHRDGGSSGSSDSDSGKRSARHGRRRRHRRGSSGSESDATSSDASDASFRRRRRRRRHRHRRSSSEDEDEDDSDHKRRSKRSKKRRDKGGDESEPEEGSRSARKAEKKKSTAALQEVEKGVSQLDVRSDEKPTEAKVTPLSSKKEELDRDRDRGKKEETERSEGSSEGRTTTVSSSRKDDEGRTSSGALKNSKAGFGRQIGEKMRSFLGGGSKKQHSSKSSSGILNACPGTVQGEEGWYEHGENERYYFVLVDGKWSLLYGPMTEDEFEVFSNRVLEQNRPIELPPTYLHKSGYYLNRELRVQREQ
ncbi:uncharacterized protein PITG_04833 [Phytophthora infestans T30-4]|uniref:SH3 domain-containing protein n=2 Tax=Phytophthora infestans TaxID=4787 RepID=D0N248_PHYIT|nr:uncharacterized protein PITG_04833 [Phytophthora infestans T30-4]EEY68377.1 conserved hypothetical protein [Phytophthora infestans T30-4]KAF4046134.1 Variant SH3 domain [Phytophthora infestans]|eukprot:XP_002905536.1 conserved hypothetical protein [Phytophthora infestans T30-4]